MTCPFCQPILPEKLLLETERSLAFYDGYPVSPGHTLVVPRRHVASFFDLTPEELDDLRACVFRVKALLDARHNSDGYNLGVNVGESAGQSVFHVHVHVIPRYCGDTPAPRGGVRGVIPGKQGYSPDIGN